MELVAGLAIAVMLSLCGVALITNLKGARDFWARGGDSENTDDKSFHGILIGIGCFLLAMGLYMVIGSLITEI